MYMLETNHFVVLFLISYKSDMNQTGMSTLHNHCDNKNNPLNKTGTYFSNEFNQTTIQELYPLA
jgi:hypothetical protein